MIPGSPGSGIRAASPGGFRALLTYGEFRWLWLADVQSLLADQLARVALIVLVYDRTGSGLASAAVYAATFLPALAGGLLLGPLADRRPRRSLLVTGDVLRAVLVVAMALPICPLGVVIALLIVVVAIGGPWKAAESALVADIVPGEAYVVGLGLRTATLQATQLAGFAVGGVVVASIGARPALLVDAVSFAVSAVVLRIALYPRPAPATGALGAGRLLSGAVAVWRTPTLRLLLFFSWLLGVLVVPEGLAAAYAAAEGGGSIEVGLLLAASPAGVLVGSLTFSRLVPAARRAAWLPVLAIAAGLPLVVCGVHVGLPATLSLWAVSGACQAYQIQVVAEFVDLVPDHIRGQGLALASGGLLAAQGLGLIAGGVVAQLTSARTAVAGAGALAVGAAVVLAVRRRELVARVRPTTPRDRR